MISKRDIYLAIAGIVLIINVITAEHFYEVGKRKVALKSTVDSLRTVEHEKVIISKQRDSIGKALRVADAKTNESRIVYVHDTNSTKIVGDIARDSNGKFIQVLDPRISKRIKDADAHIGSLERELVTAKFAFRVDTLFIAKDSQEINLHRSIEKLTSAPRVSRGLQVGVGYCRNQTGGTACLYAGYGFSVRF